MSDTGAQMPPPNRLILSSDDLPVHLDDRARARMWMELFDTYIITSDATYAADRPFSAHIALTVLEDLAFFEYRGTIDRLTRSAQQIADSGDNNFFFLGVNFDAPTGRCQLLGREATVAPGQLTLMSSIEPSRFFFGVNGDNPNQRRKQHERDPVRFVRIPREILSTLVTHPDDFALHTLNPDLPATRLLQRYLALLFQPDGLDDDPALSTHISRTVTELVGLALGADRDGTEIATARGTRAARLQLVLAGIRTGYSDPHFSAHTLAAHLGLSPRYIQDLLNETGVTFSERVLELRLQKARMMLSDPRYNGLKVGDIAFACGFNEVSYFSRSFRRRFGASPTQYRS